MCVCVYSGDQKAHACFRKIIAIIVVCKMIKNLQISWKIRFLRMRQGIMFSLKLSEKKMVPIIK